MSNPRDELEAAVRHVRELLDASRAENQQLVAEIERLTAQKSEAENRLEVADAHAEKARADLAALEELRKKQYKDVITELFRRPSRNAAILTVMVAIISIWIGVYQSAKSSQEAQQRNSQLLDRFSASLRADISGQLTQSEQRTKGEIIATQTMLRVMAEPVLSEDGVYDTVAKGVDRYYRVTVPGGVSELRITLTPLTGDADLYVRYTYLPLRNTTHPTDRSATSSSAEDTITIQNPQAGKWFVRVSGYADTSTFRLRAVY